MFSFNWSETMVRYPYPLRVALKQINESNDLSHWSDQNGVVALLYKLPGMKKTTSKKWINPFSYCGNGPADIQKARWICLAAPHSREKEEFGIAASNLGEDETSVRRS